MKNNPMHRLGVTLSGGVYPFMGSLRCGAKTRQRTACLAPAVQGKQRCRMHGGASGSGAPTGNQNALKHGFTTECAKRKRQEVKRLIRDYSTFIDNIMENAIEYLEELSAR